MPIIILIFTLFITQSMFTNNFNNNGHDKALNLQGLSDEHLVVADNLLDMEFYKNYSLEDLTAIYDGVEYKEEWKDISEYEGLYLVSTFGRIKSLSRQKGVLKNGKPRLCKQLIIKQGSKWIYKSACLYKNNKQKNLLIHRIVGYAFIPNPENKPEINHKDGNPSNNFIENLEWNTRSENILHSYTYLNRTLPKPYIGKFGGEHNQAKAINQYSKSGEFIKKWDSVIEASRGLNISSNSLVKLLKGKIKNPRKYKWQYA